MSINTDHSEAIFHQALKLSAIEKADLVEKLLSSFDFPARHAIDAAWGKEVEDRLDAFEKGKLKTKPIQQVFSEID